MPNISHILLIALKAVQMYQSKCERKLKVSSLFLAQKNLEKAKNSAKNTK